MWYRSGVVVLLGSMFGCGDSSTEGREPPASESEPAPDTPPPEPVVTEPGEPSETGFTLSIDGWPAVLGAKAELKVTEGVSLVRLAITATGREDLLLLDIPFNGIEETIGPHRGEVGLPGTRLDSALASIDGQSYQSQDGYIELSLTADGAISGTFELALAEVEDVPVGLPIAFEEGEIVRSLSGNFSGHWQLFCQSRLPGHSTLVPGGDYCESLVIE